MAKSPAFSFYAKDFLTGTATMSLAERGAYVTLLAHQWDAGAVPSGDAPRSRLLGTTVTQARKLWAVIAEKFERQADGRYLNLRLEQEREKQTDRRQKLALNGSKGGTKTQANKQQMLQQEEQQKPSLAFSSSFPSSDLTHTHRARVTANGANEPGSLPRDHMHHAVCGPKYRVCLSTWECGELMRKWGGDDPSAQKAGVQRFVTEFEAGLGPDDSLGTFGWLEKQFLAWLVSIGRAPKAPAHIGHGRDVASEIEAWGRE